MSNEQYNFVLGALARIDKKVDITNSSFQEVKIDLIHMQEDIDETRADISELKSYHPVPIKVSREHCCEFEEEFEI